MSKSATISSPLGPLKMTVSEKGLKSLSFVKDHPGNFDAIPEECQRLVNELERYFAGTGTGFSIPLDLEDAPLFHRQVWKVLQLIPFGKTRSYEEIATYLDNPKLARAVGKASGANPISIIIPCHRVLGKNGDLTGYAGGLDRKRKLLELENPRVWGHQAQLFDLAV